MLLMAVGRIMDGASVDSYIFTDSENRVYLVQPSFVFSEEFVNNAVILNCDITKGTNNSKGSISGINGFEISKNSLQKNKIYGYGNVYEAVVREFLPYAHNFELKNIHKDRKSIRFSDTVIIGDASGIKLGNNCQVAGGGFRANNINITGNNCQVAGGVIRSNNNNTSYVGEAHDRANAAIRRAMEAQDRANAAREAREAEREARGAEREARGAERGTSSQGIRNILRNNKIKGSNNCIMTGNSDDDYSIIIEDEHGNRIMAHEGDDIDIGSSGFKGIFNMFKKKK